MFCLTCGIVQGRDPVPWGNGRTAAGKVPSEDTECLWGRATACSLLAANILLKIGILKPVYEQNKCVCMRLIWLGYLHKCLQCIESEVATCFLAINNAPGVEQQILVKEKTVLNYFVHSSAVWNKIYTSGF